MKGLDATMKRNNLLLSNQLYTSLMGRVVSLVVAEAFVNSLPFDSDALANEAEGLASYSMSIVEKMHPETLIDRAIENTTNPMHREFLETLQTEISAVVEAATSRIVNSDCLGSASTPEIIRQASFEEKELDDLVSASKKAGIDAVSNIVKQKMIDTIKDERESFERADKLTKEVKEVIRDEAQELRDSLNEDDEEVPENEDASLESYLSIVLNSTDPRQPVSVFSRLLDTCMENLVYSPKEAGEVPYNALEKITLESTFPFFDLNQRSLIDDVKALRISMESTIEQNSMSPEEKAEKVKAISKTSFICTICILTLFEVLKTMNLQKPDMNMIKDFVDRQTTVQNAADTDIERIERKVDDATADIRKSVALGALTADETTIAKENLMRVKELMESMRVTPTRSAIRDKILTKLNTAIEAELVEPEREVRLDSVANRIKDANIAALNYAIKVISRRDEVATINICVDSTTPMGGDNDYTTVRAIGLGRDGKQTCEHFFQFSTASFLGSCIAEALKDCASFCDLKIGHKPVNIYFNDQGYSVPIV